MILTAPTQLERQPLGKQLPVRIFAAGGITGVEPWQESYCETLDGMYVQGVADSDARKVKLFNPVRLLLLSQ